VEAQRDVAAAREPREDDGARAGVVQTEAAKRAPGGGGDGQAEGDAPRRDRQRPSAAEGVG
jgi:hypothetical protein